MPEFASARDVLILWAVIGYVLGSVPFGMIVARMMKLGNLREIGSGNIGATNVLRTGNKKAAVLTLVLDAGKGAAVVLLARAVAAEDAAQVSALMAFIGHCFPVWLGFRGGKGVATYFGILGALTWPMGLAACAIWLVTAGITRYSSLAALATAGWMPVVMILAGFGETVIIGALLAVLIYVRHGANITRLRNGTETKIGAKT